jgi:hypothetical protein
LGIETGKSHRDFVLTAQVETALACRLFYFFGGLFDGLRHLGDRHQAAGDLIEKLVGVFFFRQPWRDAGYGETRSPFCGALVK